MRVQFTGEPVEKRPSGLGPIFEAQFESDCEGCVHPILRGEDARYYDGIVLHDACAQDLAARR